MIEMKKLNIRETRGRKTLETKSGSYLGSVSTPYKKDIILSGRLRFFLFFIEFLLFYKIPF